MNQFLATSSIYHLWDGAPHYQYYLYGGALVVHAKVMSTGAKVDMNTNCKISTDKYHVKNF